MPEPRLGFQGGVHAKKLDDGNLIGGDHVQHLNPLRHPLGRRHPSCATHS